MEKEFEKKKVVRKKKEVKKVDEELKQAVKDAYIPPEEHVAEARRIAIEASGEEDEPDLAYVLRDGLNGDNTNIVEVSQEACAPRVRAMAENRPMRPIDAD